jgi:hypothetical protein
MFTLMTEHEGTALAGALLFAAFLTSLALSLSGYVGLSLSDKHLIVAPHVVHEAHCMTVTLYYDDRTAEIIRIPTVGQCTQIEIERFPWHFVDGHITRIDQTNEGA